MRIDCLIVDDEEVLAETTSEYLNMFDVKAAHVTSREACLSFLAEHEASLILLDINLGKTSGFDLCKQLREMTQIPILFISARASDDDVLIALNIGGDDYIHKPYALSVLLAKVKAVLRRYQNQTEVEVSACNRISVDFKRCRVTVDGEEVYFKAMEYKLLCYLLSNRNRVIPKEELFRNVWGDTITSDGTLNVHIRHLREKIEIDPNAPKHISTVWGTGYMFEDDNR